LNGEILRHLGKEKESASFAHFVAERWPAADHDEAVELWNAVSAEQRPESEPLSDEVPKETLSVDGHITTLKCGHKDVQPDLTLTGDGKVFPFHLKDLSAGFSDTIWYREDHFTLCHHLPGMRAVIRYKAATHPAYAGDVSGIEIRDELPPPPTKAAKATSVDAK
jgi:hypothetical protein